MKLCNKWITEATINHILIFIPGGPRVIYNRELKNNAIIDKLEHKSSSLILKLQSINVTL